MPTIKRLPNADGTPNAYEWYDKDSDNIRHEEVDEDPHDGDTSFISTSDVSITAHNSRFTKAAIELPDGATIDSVEVHMVCRRVYVANPTVPLVYMGFTIGSTDYSSTSRSVSSDTYFDYSASFLTDPSTGLAWTEEGVDAAELWVKGQSNRTRVSLVWWYTNVQCTQVYMIVNYTEAGGVQQSLLVQVL